jgi:DNA-binding response OmpR family regulator
MAKILVVDDNESTLKLINSILYTRGHMTVSANEPRDAIEKLSGEFFDLVITDVMMPGGITGFDFVRTLRAKSEFAQIPIIIVTGRRERRDIEKGVKSGADDYVVKPIDPEILISKINSLLDKKTNKQNDFTAGAVKAPAEWDMPLEIVQITELGLEIQSSLPVPVGSKIKLKSDFFDEVGIHPPVLRVVACNLQPETNLHQIQVHFVGLTEKEMTPIRLWIRSSKVSKNAG